MEELAKKIEHYLKTDCSDEWHVKIKKGNIVGYYTAYKRFELNYDEDIEEWYVSGNFISVEMISNIFEIIKENQ